MRNGYFSVAVVVNGVEQVDRQDGTVLLPTGTEYSLRFRTHNARRAVANISIDGVDVTRGGLVVPSFGFVDLETPPASPGQRFKFVSSDSSDAYGAGKAGPDTDGSKGLIKVEMRSEKVKEYFAKVPNTLKQLHSDDVGLDSCGFGPTVSNSPRGYGRGSSCSIPTSHVLGRTGVTVGGSVSSQTFYDVDMELDDVTTTLLLKLKVGGPAYAYTTKSYDRCSNCGRVADTLSNVCHCGTNLR